MTIALDAPRLVQAQPLLTAQNVSKTYGDVQAVRDVSAEVFPGEVLGIVGEMALIDLALQVDVARQECSAFVAEQQSKHLAEDHDCLCRIEATRVDMETF